jgi:ABC-type sugar transport system substrate-binding protein
MSRPNLQRWRRVGAVALTAVAAGSLLAACASGTGSGSTGSAKTMKIGVITDSSQAGWGPLQGTVAQALAKKRGWTSVVLDDNNDPATFTKDVNTLIQDKVTAVVGFMQETGANAAAAKRFAAAKIPVLTYDIAEPGWYFVGIDNAASGKLNGQALGAIVKSKWNCDVDLVMEGHASQVGVIDKERTNGEAAGLASVCPNIPTSAFKNFETAGSASTGLPAARNLLTANPSAKNIVAVGINDPSVEAALDAHKQLGGSSQIIGWGQDGSLIGTSGASPQMLGSAFYFLEGYPYYAFQVLDKIAKGTAPKATAADTASTGTLIKPCVVTAAQAKAIPDITTRATKVGSTDKSPYDLFCPAK